MKRVNTSDALLHLRATRQVYLAFCVFSESL